MNTNSHTETEIIHTRVPGLQPVLECRQHGLLESIYHYWKYDLRRWYYAICLGLYLMYIVYRALLWNGITLSDMPRIGALNIAEVMLAIALIMSIPIAFRCMQYIRGRRLIARYRELWAGDGTGLPTAAGSSPQNVMTNGQDLYLQSLTPTALYQDYSGDPYHEPITRIEIYEDPFRKGRHLRMMVYYMAYWGNPIAREQRCDICLDDITQESIDRLMQYSATSVTQRYRQ